MSTIRADNFGNRAGTSSIPADTMLQGTAKAWANINQSGVQSIYDSFNISSITDLSTGQTQLNMTASQPNAAYIVMGCSYDPGTTDRIVNGRGGTVTTTSIFGILGYFTGTGVAVDINKAMAMLMGDST